MKNTIIIFAYLLLLLTSCSSPRHYNESQIKNESARLNEFFENIFEEKTARYPTWQTYLGRKTNYNLLDNETEAYSEEDHRRDIKNLEMLKKFNYQSMDEATQTSYRIMKYDLELSIEGWKWRYHSFPLNQMFGYQSDTPSFLINMHEIQSEEDALAYISRIKEIKRVFDEKLVFVKKQESLGIIPPHFVFEKVINDSRNIISGTPFDTNKKSSPLLEDFLIKVKKLKISNKKRQSLISAAKRALKEFVLPAYKDLIAYLEHLGSKNKLNRGAWSLPDGKEFYEYSLKSITTTDLKADEIHETGLKEVKRIQEEMKTIMAKVGFKGNLQDFFIHMRGNKYIYPNNASGRNAYLKEVNKVLARIKAELPKLFKTFPKAQLLVKPVEAFREKSAGTAFYSGPSMEGNRPGIYYINLYKMADVPKYKLEALAYHEAIPGHHMQIAISKELEGLPKFRRSGGFTAYTEGWGLYSELLPKEICFYQDPYSDFGRLSMEIWRATRLVVDTGIHAKKWSREKAIAFMTENTPNAELETIKEIERYFVMPGQATAYKVGMMKFLSLREFAKKELKEKFDIRDFHDVVLRDGGLPLDILEEKVFQWVQLKK